MVDPVYATYIGSRPGVWCRVNFISVISVAIVIAHLVDVQCTLFSMVRGVLSPVLRVLFDS